MSNTDIQLLGMATKTQRLLDVIMVTSTQRQNLTSLDVDLWLVLGCGIN